MPPLADTLITDYALLIDHFRLRRHYIDWLFIVYFRCWYAFFRRWCCFLSLWDVDIAIIYCRYIIFSMPPLMISWWLFIIDVTLYIIDIFDGWYCWLLAYADWCRDTFFAFFHFLIYIALLFLRHLLTLSLSHLYVYWYCRRCFALRRFILLIIAGYLIIAIFIDCFVYCRHRRDDYAIAFWWCILIIRWAIDCRHFRWLIFDYFRHFTPLISSPYFSFITIDRHFLILLLMRWYYYFHDFRHAALQPTLFRHFLDADSPMLITLIFSLSLADYFSIFIYCITIWRRHYYFATLRCHYAISFIIAALIIDRWLLPLLPMPPRFRRCRHYATPRCFITPHYRYADAAIDSRYDDWQYVYAMAMADDISYWWADISLMPLRLFAITPFADYIRYFLRLIFSLIATPILCIIADYLFSPLAFFLIVYCHIAILLPCWLADTLADYSYCCHATPLYCWCHYCWYWYAFIYHYFRCWPLRHYWCPPLIRHFWYLPFISLLYLFHFSLYRLFLLILLII